VWKGTGHTITKLTYTRTCDNTYCELRVYKDFLQVVVGKRQVAAFHLSKVRALLGERREDEGGGADAPPVDLP
jgi:hypothetical protein